MDVCEGENIDMPMTDPGEQSDEEKSGHVDPRAAAMELKVLGSESEGTTNTGPQLPLPLPSTTTTIPQQRVSNIMGGPEGGAVVAPSPHTAEVVNGHVSEGVGGGGIGGGVSKNDDSVYDFDPETEGDIPSGMALEDSSETSHDKHSDRSETSDSNVKNEPELDTLDDSEMAEDESVAESYEEGQDYTPIEPEHNVMPDNFQACVVPRRGRGRPRGSKNRVDGRGRGRGLKFRQFNEDRTCTAYDLRNIPDPFACQRRGRPRSRFIVDLGEQNHEAWTKSKEDLNISDAELTTLLLSL